MWDFPGLVLWAMYGLGLCPRPKAEDGNQSQRRDAIY